MKPALRDCHWQPRGAHTLDKSIITNDHNTITPSTLMWSAWKQLVLPETDHRKQGIIQTHKYHDTNDRWSMHNWVQDTKIVINIHIYNRSAPIIIICYKRPFRLLRFINGPISTKFLIKRPILSWRLICRCPSKQIDDFIVVKRYLDIYIFFCQ